MGGIACVTPLGEVVKETVSRPVKVHSAQTIRKFGDVPVKLYRKPSVPGLKLVVFGPLEAPKPDPPGLMNATSLDYL